MNDFNCVLYQKGMEYNKSLSIDKTAKVKGVPYHGVKEELSLWVEVKMLSGKGRGMEIGKTQFNR
jgi:hypothetical protein